MSSSGFLQLESKFQLKSFEIDDAHKMLQKWIDWRIEKKINQLKADDYPEFIQLNVFELLGKDKNGRLVLYNLPKKIVPDEL